MRKRGKHWSKADTSVAMNNDQFEQTKKNFDIFALGRRRVLMEFVCLNLKSVEL